MYLLTKRIETAVTITAVVSIIKYSNYVTIKLHTLLLNDNILDMCH